MKRTLLILAIALALVGTAIAQPAWGNHPMMGRGYGNAQAPALDPPKAASIEGKLVFVDSYPAVQTKDKTYMIHMPQFFKSAYTDGIKEGAAVKADGFELPSLPGQDKPNFQVTKATIGGKTYDFTSGNFGRGGMMGGKGGCGPMSGGRGGRGGRW